MFQIKKARSRWYPTKILPETYDQQFFANTPPLGDPLLQRLIQAARDIEPYVIADKTEFMYFKQKGAISTFSDKPLK